MQDRVLSMLGMAAKAGAVASGGFLTEKAIKEHKARLVIIASDASGNTRDNISNKTTFYKFPLCFYGTKETIGHAIGKADRSCVAVLDRGFADSIRKLVEASSSVQSE